MDSIPNIQAGALYYNINMANDYIIRVGDGDHYRSSTTFSRWGITAEHAFSKMFMRTVIPGDRLWFLQNGGKLLGAATFVSTNQREVGPLIQFTPTNEELGWTKKTGNWDTEVHYKNLFDLEKCDMKLNKIRARNSILKFNLEMCGINLPEEYPRIVMYSNVVRK